MTSSDVRASVIIPTFNRHDLLRSTLATLSRQRYPTSYFETIVVDDGSTDDTSSLATDAYPFTLRYLRQTNQGCAIARNVGARQSRGRLLIFLDDDITLEPGYVQALVSEHERLSNIVGMGALFPYFGDPATPFRRWARRVSPRQSISHFVAFRECASNNLSIERDDFFRLGEWRSVARDGQALWGDVEFGYRAAQAGMRFRRCADAICYHQDYAISDLRAFSVRMRRSAQLAHALFQLHPEIESELPMFRDMSAPDYRLDSALLVARKHLRAASATAVCLKSQEVAAAALERVLPRSNLLAPLYRWIIGAYIYRGFREGGRHPASYGDSMVRIRFSAARQGSAQRERGRQSDDR